MTNATNALGNPRLARWWVIRQVAWLGCFLLATLISTAAAESQAKLKVLVVTGGHGFDRKPFFQMFEDNPQITFTHAEHATTNATVYEREDLLGFDAVVLYDMAQRITDAQKSKFLSLFEKGVGLVVLHHALASYQQWPEYGRLIGGHYLEPNPEKPGTVTEQAGYEHEVDIPVVVVAKDHPVTAGVKDFTLRDEIYWGFRVERDVTPLLTTTHPKSGKPLAWTRTEGKSRVVFIQLGHGPQPFEDANYRRLVAQSIRWAAKEPARAAIDYKPWRFYRALNFNTRAVFDTRDGFVGAWHLADEGGMEEGGYKDATANAAHGTGINLARSSRVEARGGPGLLLRYNATQWVRVGGEKRRLFDLTTNVTFSI